MESDALPLEQLTQRGALSVHATAHELRIVRGTDQFEQTRRPGRGVDHALQRFVGRESGKLRQSTLFVRTFQGKLPIVARRVDAQCSSSSSAVAASVVPATRERNA